MKPLKIAATDLTFLLDRCPSCFHAKVVEKWKQPRQPFPSVFGKLDRLQSECYHQFEAEALGLPPGRLDTKSMTVLSKPIKLGSLEVQFSGRTDAGVHCRDGTFAPVEQKTSAMDKDGFLFYLPQLWAYSEALTHPAKDGPPAKISKVAVLSFSPVQAADLSIENQTIIRFDRSTFVADMDWTAWYEFLRVKVLPALINKPEPTKGCRLCELRHAEQIAIK